MLWFVGKWRLEMDQCFLNLSHISHIHTPLLLLFFTYCFSFFLVVILFHFELGPILSSNNPKATKHHNVFPKAHYNKHILVYITGSEIALCHHQIHFPHFGDCRTGSSEHPRCCLLWFWQCSSHQNEQLAHPFIHQALSENQLCAWLCARCQDGQNMGLCSPCCLLWMGHYQPRENGVERATKWPRCWNPTLMGSKRSQGHSLPEISGCR